MPSKSKIDNTSLTAPIYSFIKQPQQFCKDQLHYNQSNWLPKVPLQNSNQMPHFLNLDMNNNNMCNYFASVSLDDYNRNTEKLLNFFNYSSFLTNQSDIDYINNNFTNSFMSALTPATLLNDTSFYNQLKNGSTGIENSLSNKIDNNQNFLTNKSYGNENFLDDLLKNEKLNRMNYKNYDHQDFLNEEIDSEFFEYEDYKEYRTCFKMPENNHAKSKKELSSKGQLHNIDQVMWDAYEEEENLVIEIEKVQNNELRSVLAQEAKLTKQLSFEKQAYLHQQKYQKNKSDEIETETENEDQVFWKKMLFQGEESQNDEMESEIETSRSMKTIHMQEKILSMSRKS